MREIFYPNKNIIVADFDYQSALFLFKNAHPELDIKIISRNDLINKISYSFLKDPIPFLLTEGIGYKKAKKYLDILLTADASKNEELTNLFNKLDKEGYLVKDEYGAYELKDSHIYLFEMEEDTAIMELLKRNNFQYQSLRLEDLDLIKNNAYISPNIIYFENKFTQFFYIFSWIRDKAKENSDQKHRIIINGDEDIFYVKIMSDIFNLPICYVEEKPLLSDKKVKSKLNDIYKTKAYNFTDEELEDQEIKALKDLIEYYGLDKLSDFSYSYANLLEIVASKNTRVPVGNGGVTVSNKFVFDPTFFTYVTNFNSDAFYKVFADDNVLPDATLKEIGYNTSYDRTAMDRRKKKNFLRHNNVAVISRVKKHLNDKIFDSPIVKEQGWEGNIRDEEDLLELSTFTSPAAFLYSSAILDKSGLKFESDVFNAYDPCFKGIANGNDFKKNKWSVTNLETYVSCPFKYYLSTLIPLKRDDYSRRFNGTFIHKVFEKFNHADFDIDKAFKEGEEAYYKQFEKNGIEPSNKDKAFLEITKYWLSKFIKTYRKTVNEISFVNPVNEDYEKHIEFALEDQSGTYNFSGYIDKIAITESGDKKYYSIIDYKTGAESFNPLEVFLGKSIQLPLYYYAIENNIQPDFYTQGASFGGFYIQHVFFSTIKSALKHATKPYLSEKKLISESRYEGINLDSVSYIRSMDPSAFKEDGSLKKGSNLLQIKHQFTEADATEQIIDSKKVTIPEYNLNALVKDAKEAAISIINRICNGDFPIAPTSYSLDEFNSEKLVCNNCPYRAVCYRSNFDAVDYRKAILKRFQKGEK